MWLNCPQVTTIWNDDCHDGHIMWTHNQSDGILIGANFDVIHLEFELEIPVSLAPYSQPDSR